MAPPLHRQLGVPRSYVRNVERDYDAILRLRLRGYLSDAARDKAYKRLLQEIPKAVQAAVEERRRHRTSKKADAGRRSGQEQPADEKTTAP